MDGLEVGFEPWVAVTALEAAGANYFFGCEGAEDGGDDFVGWGFVVLFELAFVFFQGFSVGVLIRREDGKKRRTYSDMLSSAVISSSRVNCMTRYW